MSPRLTKKEKAGFAFLRSHKALVEPVDDQTKTYMVAMNLTQGELLALKHALDAYATPVGEDVRAYLNNALQRSNIEL